MLSRTLRITFIALVLALLTLLTACGGGRGGSGATNTGVISVNPGSLHFDAVYGDVYPADQNLSVRYPGDTAYLLLGFPPGKEVDWLDIYQLSSSNPAEVSISILDTYMSVGDHSATVRIAAVSLDGKVLGYTDVPVTLTIHGELKVTPTSLNLLHVIGGQPASASLSLSDTAGGSSAWSASSSYTSGQGWLQLNSEVQTGGNSLPANLNITASADLAAGEYQATINLSADGTTVSVPVAYTVREPKLLLDKSSLAFSSISGQSTLPANQTINVSSETGIALDYTTSVTYTPNTSNWLSLPASATSGTALTATVNTTDLAPGNYTAQLTLTPANGTTARQFTVSYQVTPSELSAFPASFAFTVNDTTTEASLTDTAILNRTGGALSWTASSSVPWLSVSPNSGSTGEGESITLSFVVSELEPLSVATHDAEITLNYSDAYGTLSTLKIPVTLDMQLPLFSAVTPYAAYSDRSEEVVLRGQGFDTMTGKDLILGNTAISNFTISNGTEIRFNHPVLPAQRCLIRADNTLGLTRSTAELVVVDPHTYDYTAIPTSESTRKMLFDPERQTLYAVKWNYYSANERIDSYTFNGSGWDKKTLPLQTARDVALTPDGKALIVLSKYELYHVDPATMTITLTVTDNPTGYVNYLDQLLFLNNGSGFMTIGYSWDTIWDYNADTDAFTNIPIDTATRSLYSPRLAASLDRSIVLLGENGVTSAALYSYDPETQKVSSTPYDTHSSFLSVDRLGKHFCIDSTVYDGNFTLLGTLPSSFSICSPDGTRAYIWSSVSNAVRTFDLTQSDGNGSFVEIDTEIVLADNHSSGTAPVLAISQDGKTLFIGGDLNILIVPLP